ncbi:MAG: class I SAM-dependent methyltransferase [Pseudomonadota bacterium]|nr:class I SAM-dependent methyltransferase [Pseudomonadota bacterium]
MATHPQQQLDLARQQWLAGLARQHQADGTWASALALAQGHYLCGDYAAALDHFIAARDLGRDRAETHLALVRMASGTGRPELEQQALAEALRWFPDSAPLALHAALHDVPHALSKARERLAPFPQDAACNEFTQALDALLQDRPIPAGPDLDPAARARRTGMRWVQQHAASPQVFCGMPVDVLMRALRSARSSGLTLECGVYFGRSLRLIAQATQGEVHGFDSFQGLPEAWSDREGAGAYSTAGRLPEVTDSTRLHPGWFQDTLPPFLREHPGPVRLLHIDCDLYSSTKTVLECMDDRLVPGSMVVFDDLLGYPGYEQHELKAFEEFASEQSLGWEIVAAALLGREVAVRITSR